MATFKHILAILDGAAEIISVECAAAAATPPAGPPASSHSRVPVTRTSGLKSLHRLQALFPWRRVGAEGVRVAGVRFSRLGEGLSLLEFRRCLVDPLQLSLLCSGDDTPGTRHDVMFTGDQVFLALQVSRTSSFVDDDDSLSRPGKRRKIVPHRCALEQFTAQNDLEISLPHRAIPVIWEHRMRESLLSFASARGMSEATPLAAAHRDLLPLVLLHPLRALESFRRGQCPSDKISEVRGLYPRQAPDDNDNGALQDGKPLTADERLQLRMERMFDPHSACAMISRPDFAYGLDEAWAQEKRRLLYRRPP